MSTILPPTAQPAEPQQGDYKDAKANAKAAKAYAKAQRPWFKKKRFVLPALLILVIVMFQATNSGKDAGKGTVGSQLDSTTSPSASTSDQSTASEAAPSETAAVTSAPVAPVVKPTVFSGNGNKIIRFKKPFKDAMLMTTTWKAADANITAYEILPDGSEGDLLVNAIDRYKGQTIMNLSADNAIGIEMSGGGAWKVKIEPLANAKHWDGSGTYSGQSDGVVVVKGAFAPADSIKFVSSRADANVTLYAIDSDGNENLVVNDIDNFAGEFLVPSDSMIFQISSDGRWTIKKS
jgi:hypothetical protein